MNTNTKQIDDLASALITVTDIVHSQEKQLIALQRDIRTLTYALQSHQDVLSLLKEMLT